VFYLNRLQHEGKKLEKKKDQQAQIENSKNSFKPQIAQTSELLALQRKKKVAAQLGIDMAEVDARDIDPVEFLRAQGQLSSMNKEERAQKVQEAKFAKECTFAPALSKKPIVTATAGARGGRKLNEPQGRTSTSSINLEPIMKKKTGASQSADPFAKASGLAGAGADPKKYDQLYNLRKKQIDKTDKTKEDYEFERQ